MKHLKYIFIAVIVLAAICVVIGAVSTHETNAYLDSVDAFIAEVEG